jgi:putative DNA primase/helicase
MSTSSAAGLDPTAVRLEMLAQGYRPVPVLRFDAKDKAAGKRPTLPEWQTVCEAADETEIRRWARDSGQRNCLNTGLLCGSVVGLDLDVPDEALARQINALADAMLPPTPLIRIGRSPKSLRAFRAEGVHTKASTPALFLPGGIKVQVEALGKGNHFVSFGTHPDTQLPYTWPHQSPLDVRFDDLPYCRTPLSAHFLSPLKPACARQAAELKPKSRKPPRVRPNPQPVHRRNRAPPAATTSPLQRMTM